MSTVDHPSHAKYGHKRENHDPVGRVDAEPLLSGSQVLSKKHDRERNQQSHEEADDPREVAAVPKEGSNERDTR